MSREVARRETIYNDPLRHDFKLVGDHRTIVIVADAEVVASAFVVNAFTGEINIDIEENLPSAGKTTVTVTLPDNLAVPLQNQAGRDYVLKLQLTGDTTFRNVLSGKLQFYSLRSWSS